ncbi:hypothetical protein [Paenibacillus chungangensis]|uniref:Uncharacterized protein n=1 Tax=Paenibacillus chungangensis TaxID=696535 RepID=A0ABW3HKD8_9BACL
MGKAVYVAQLSKQEQEEIAAKLRALLVTEGLSEIEVFRAVKDAMDSKIADVVHLIESN